MELRELGILSIATMWLGTVLLLRHHGTVKTLTISEHAALHPKSYAYFAALEITVVTGFTVFLLNWLIPTYRLGILFEIATVVGYVGTFLAALVPDVEGRKGTLHGIFAYSMAAALTLMTILLATSPNISSFSRVISIIAAAYMITGWLVAGLKPATYRAHILIYQVVYFVVFHATMLTATYF